jgi:hypothetical protein
MPPSVTDPVIVTFDTLTQFNDKRVDVDLFRKNNPPTVEELDPYNML